MPAAKFGISGNSAAGVRADPEGKAHRKTQAKEEMIMEIPRHVAIILDGNGRWAKSRNMPRNYGHVKGMAQIVLNDQIVIRGLRITEGSNGMFIGYPIDAFYKGEDFRNICNPITRQLREHIENCVLEKYHASVAAAG